MAEETNAAVKSLSQKFHLCLASRLLELLGSCLRVQLSAIAVNGFSSFLCLQMLVQSAAFCAVRCKAIPVHNVEVDCLYISHADIFILQMRAAGGSPTQRQTILELCIFGCDRPPYRGHAWPNHRSIRCLSRRTYREGRHKTARQRWTLCLARICP